MDKLYDLYISGGLSKERFIKKHQPLEDRFSAISKELTQCEVGDKDRECGTYSSIQTLRDAWDILSCSAKNELVSLITHRIEAGSTTIKITFSISSSSL